MTSEAEYSPSEPLSSLIIEGYWNGFAVIVGMNLRGYLVVFRGLGSCLVRAMTWTWMSDSRSD